MLQAQTKRLHAVCAKALSGGQGVDTAQLAHHHECGGMAWQAARLFYSVHIKLREEVMGLLDQRTPLLRVRTVRSRLRCIPSTVLGCLGSISH